MDFDIKTIPIEVFVKVLFLVTRNLIPTIGKVQTGL